MSQICLTIAFMLKKTNAIRLRTSFAALIAMFVLLGIQTVASPELGGSGQVAHAAGAKTYKGKQYRGKRFFRGCTKSRVFNENRVGYAYDTVMGGRCVTSRVRGIKLISSYAGHHPSAGKAMDVMVNLQGSCNAGRKVGRQVAKYFMYNAAKHDIQYIIWRNRYWSASYGPKDPKNWRSQGWSGCTHAHYDHVHVAFR